MSEQAWTGHVSLEELAERLPGALYAFRGDSTGRLAFTYLSAGVRELLGYTAQEIMADVQLFLGRIEPGDAQRFMDAGTLSLQEMQRFEWTGRVRTSSGELRHLRLVSLPKAQSDGSFEWAGQMLDVTAEVAIAHRLEESERAKGELVERLRLAVDELSTPILEVADRVLALPMIGVVDSRRAVQIMDKVLETVADKQSRTVILDLTGVEVIDTKTADYFVKLVRAVELLGAQAVISGIRPAVAQSLVDLGVDLGNVRTSRTLRTAIAAALSSANPASGAARREGVRA